MPLLVLLPVFGRAVFRGQPSDVGRPAPSFELERLDAAGRISSEQLRARPYVLNFWASWCVPCREEAPVLVKVVGSGLEHVGFVGVNMLDGRDDALEFLSEFAIRYPNGIDERGAYRRFSVKGIPETIFVDRRGTVVGRYVGAIDEQTLRRLLTKLLTLRPGELLPVVGSGQSVSVS